MHYTQEVIDNTTVLNSKQTEANLYLYLPFDLKKEKKRYPINLFAKLLFLFSAVFKPRCNTLFGNLNWNDIFTTARAYYCIEFT